MSGIMSGIIMLGTPIMAVIWFIGNIILYIKCPKEMIKEKKGYLIEMIVSGIVAVFFVSALIGLIILFGRAGEHM